MKLSSIPYRVRFRQARQRPPAARRTPVQKAKSAFGCGLLIFSFFHLGLLYLAHQSPRIRDPIYGDRLHLLQRVAREKADGMPELVLMLGSSRAANGFDAGRLEQQLDETSGKHHVAFNFGMVGSGPLIELLYLQRLIRAGIRPKLLLVEVYPLFLIDDGDQPYEARWLSADRYQPDETAAVSEYGIAAGAIESGYRNLLLNPFGELRWQLMSRMQPSWLPSHIGYRWTRQTDARGWVPMYPATRTAEQRQRSTRLTQIEIADIYCAKEWGVPALRIMHGLQEMCRENNIPMRWLLMPESSTFRSWYAPGLEDRIGKLRRDLTEPWIDARIWVPDEEFADGHHLLPAGARLFTDRLAKELGAGPATPQSH